MYSFSNLNKCLLLCATWFQESINVFEKCGIYIHNVRIGRIGLSVCLFVTSLAKEVTKEVMFLVALVCLFVCLFVCLSVCGQHYLTSYERIGMKF